MSMGAWVNAHYDEIGPIKWLALGLEVVAATVLFLMMAMTCVDVTGRYLFSNSLDGATELTRIGLAVMVFAELPVVTWRGGHIVVDLLDRVLGNRIVKALGLLAALAVSSSMYFIGARIFDLAERSLRRGVETEYLGLPTGYIIEYIAVMSWFTALGMFTYGIYRIFAGSNN
ncbi:TRAP transporter small permease [Marinobacterium lutimaris]|uniref:TRAP transporter small permease protein n=1 Tax=Marinobacterium lutimaris TaxID=568106 RepID=A0A1H5WIZ4_9GAMM|nr:TRAP transporter small permease [Marinobacterium lutimaris]SEF99444.1 TRAP-type C4-dicarboxylate transport system, small permease component [Marinobacterium lutimaris]